MEYTLSECIPIIADDISLDKIGSTVCETGSYLPLPSLSDGFLIFTVSEGELSYTIDDNLFLLRKHQAAVIPAALVPSVFAKEHTQCLYCCCSGTLVHKILLDTISHGGFIFPPGYGYYLDLEIQKMLNFYEDSKLNDENLLPVLFQLLTKLYRQTAPVRQQTYPPLVDETIHIIQEEFAYLYGVEEIADRLFVTKNHLIRIFTSHVGISPGKYLTQVRIENAKLLLQSGEHSLELVSTSCGFSGANYFCKVFRKETGMSPGEFLRTAPHIESTAIPHEIYL